MIRLPAVVVASCLSILPVAACDLCAIYSADNTRGQSSSGFLFTVSEQFTSYRTILLDGEEVTLPKPDWLDSSITHLVPTYNFSKRFGVSLNVPLSYRSFRRTDLRYSHGSPPVKQTETGSELDLGDVALVGRWAVWQKNEIYRLGQQIRQRETKLVQLQGDNKRLSDQISILHSPVMLDRRTKDLQLGLAPATPLQVVRLDEPTTPAPQNNLSRQFSQRSVNSVTP